MPIWPTRLRRMPMRCSPAALYACRRQDSLARRGCRRNQAARPATATQLTPSPTSASFSPHVAASGPATIVPPPNRELPMAARQYETDVAIVGAGAAGIAAGLEARDAGARAIAFGEDDKPRPEEQTPELQ